MKTKPAQSAVRQLLSFGLTPDFVLARAEKELDDKRINKLVNNFGKKNLFFLHQIWIVFLKPVCILKKNKN